MFTNLAMQSDGDSELGDLKAQLTSKEMKWKKLQALNIHQLENYLKKAQEECSPLRYVSTSLQNNSKCEHSPVMRHLWTVTY